MISDDPTVTDPEHYAVLWENEHVRVLEYRDDPGESTTPHRHPNSVMVALTDFSRRLVADGRTRDARIEAGSAAWLPAQRHSGRTPGRLPPASSSSS